MPGARDYLLTHREPPPAVGLLVLREDFGAQPAPPPEPVPPPEPPPPPDWVRQIDEAAAEIQRLVAQAQADRCPWDASKATYQRSMAQIMDHDIGPIHDWAAQIRALLPKAGEPAPAPPPSPAPPPAPAPPPSPPPARVLGFGVSYQGHDPAVDCYPGLTDEQREWGPHHGIEIAAPAPGRVEAYTFPTPLAVYRELEPEARDALRALFRGWCCVERDSRSHWLLAWVRRAVYFDDAPLEDPDDALWVTPDAPVLPYQTMYVAAYWPDEPLVVDGQRLRLLHFGHVHPTIRTGRVQAGDVFARVWDTGIRFEVVGIQARAAHVHCAASTSGQLSPNGDISGLLAIKALGWDVQFRGAQGPGPNEYYSGQWVAGRRRSDFQQAGRPIPPMPE
jgi:hypothetical protein